MRTRARIGAGATSRSKTRLPRYFGNRDDGDISDSFDSRRKHCFVCLSCRKGFRPANRGRTLARCPQCGGQVHNLGIYFKLPRRRDAAAWRHLTEQLEAVG